MNFLRVSLCLCVLFSLYVSTLTSNDGAIAVYSINQTSGAVTLVSTDAIAPAKCSDCSPYDSSTDLAMTPTGMFLLAPGATNGVVYVYKVNATTGALTNVAGSPFIDMEPCGSQCSGATPYSITVDAKSRFVYVENQTADFIANYSLNDTTGALTTLPQTNPPYGSFIYWPNIRADPSGNFVFLLGWDLGKSYPDNAAIVSLKIGSSGALTEAPSSPYPNIGLYGNYPVDGVTVTP